MFTAKATQKLQTGRAHFDKQKDLLHEAVKKATEMKRNFEEKSSKVEQMKLPMNALKKELKALEKTRKDLIRKQSAKQKLIARSNQKIRDYNNEIVVLQDEMENDERAQRLSQVFCKMVPMIHELVLSELEVEMLVSFNCKGFSF